MVKPHLVEKYNLESNVQAMTNVDRQTARQTHKVITYQEFNRCQQSAENSIKYHFGNLLLNY